MFLVEVLTNALGQLIGEVLGETIEQKLDRRALKRDLRAAAARAEARFAREYRQHDAELATALAEQTRFADLPSVQAALRDILTRPFHSPQAGAAVLHQSFADVLPARLDRARVDAAVRAFLAMLGDEVLYIPQLRELYVLAFQKTSAEQSRAAASNTAALLHSFEILRDDMRLLAAAPAPAALPPPRPALPWHNLPQRAYPRFVGRQVELEKLAQLLLPHPRSRHFVITLDGIGGVGKSALALELAYRYRDGYASLPEAERFDAIVWVSAKRTLLTASGIQQRQQRFNTLHDLYGEIGMVLEQPAIAQSDAAQQTSMVERALAAQRTLLIVDNLETVDDEELLTFLRELPDPTKAIVTTRHRIDIAYSMRLSGMPEPDAQALMLVEAARKGVDLPPAASVDLFRRTGGIPLAIVWSIGLMSLGYSVESVLRRLGSGQSDIARFCFAESMARICGRDAERLLFALALFERSVSRAMLGEVAGLTDDIIGRDDGLAELLQLALVDQNGERFKLLPLTHSFALDALAQQPALESELRERWLDVLTELAAPFNRPHWQQPDRGSLRRDGEHLATLARWAVQHERPDLLLAVGAALGAYYDAVGRWPEMLELYLRMIEYARLLGDRATLRNELKWYGWAIGQQERVAEANQAFAESLALAEELGDGAWHAEILVNMAQLARRANDTAAAQAHCEAALALLERIAPEEQAFVRADITIEQGKIARDTGDWDAALAAFRAARDVFQTDLHNPGFNMERAWGAYSQFAFVTHRMGHLPEAAKMYAKSLAAIREIGSRSYLATLLVRYAELEMQRGDRAAALAFAREALEWSQKLGVVAEQRQAAALLAQLGEEESQ